MRNKILSVILSVLLLPLNSFAFSKKDVYNYCQKDSKSCNCFVSKFIYDIYTDDGYKPKGEAGNRVYLGTLRKNLSKCRGPEYVGTYDGYMAKIRSIPGDLESPSSTNKGDIKAQYVYHDETYNYLLRMGNVDKASKYFTANVQILLTNMITNAWAARTIKDMLEQDLLTDSEKDAALMVLNKNLQHIKSCRSFLCNIPSSVVNTIPTLIGGCDEDACLLTALHIELLESLIKSGAKSVSVNDAIQTMFDVLFKKIVESEDGDKKGKSREFGNQKSNTIVKVPAMMAILNLPGGEDNFNYVAGKILDNSASDYSDSNAGVIMMIMQRYENMGKFNLIKNELSKKGNVVANMEANIILGAHPEVLTAQQKEDISKVLHDNYANKTTACDGMKISNNGARYTAKPTLSGYDAKFDAMLKQRMCESYDKLKWSMPRKQTNLDKEGNIQGGEEFCTPCEGNVSKSASLEVQEFIVEFIVEEFLDDVVLAVLTAGVGLVEKKFVTAAKYTAKIAKRTVKTVDKTMGRFVDKIPAKVKQLRSRTKAGVFKLRENSKGKQIIDWVDDATDVSKDANKAGKTFNKADDAAQIAKAEENTAKGIKNVKNTNVTNKIDDTAKTFGNSGNVGNAVGANASAMTGTTHTLPQAEVVGSKPPKIERSTLNSVPSNTMSDKQIAEEMAYRSRVKERSQKLNDEIGKLNNQIRDNEEGLISRFTKKSETEQLKAQRDVLQRQQSINEALSNPNIKVNKTSSGYEAVAKNGKKDVLSKQELDTYVKSLNEEDQARFLNRNSNLDKENILPKQETTSLTKEGQVKSLNNEHEKAHGGPVHHLKTTAKKMAINETALKTKENIDKQKHKIHYYKTTSNAKKTKKVIKRNGPQKQVG